MGLFLRELPGAEGPAQDFFGFLGGVTCSPAGFPRRRAMAVAMKLRVRLRCFVSRANDPWTVARILDGGARPCQVQSPPARNHVDFDFCQIKWHTLVNCLTNHKTVQLYPRPPQDY
jgi:hypothetical protein